MTAIDFEHVRKILDRNWEKKRYTPPWIIKDVIDEIDRLTRWKREALIVIEGWEETWESAGRPGSLGESKSLAVAKQIDEVREKLSLDGDK